MRTTQDSPEERLAAARACLEQLCPAAEGERRAAVASAGIRHLVDYRAYLAALEDGGEVGCPGLRGQLAERAFAAEAGLRVLLAEGLKSLNDLRDSGMLHAGLSELAHTLEGGDKDLSRLFREAREELEQGPLALPVELSDEAVTMVERGLIGLGYDSETDALVVRRVGLADGGPEEIHVPLAPRAGEIGRIDLDQFFGAGGRFGVQAELIFAPPSDCHQRATLEVETPRVVDAYAGILGGMAAAREAMYRHARKVSRYGHGTALRGEDPVSAAITAAVLLGIGTLMGSVLGPASLGPVLNAVVFALLFLAVSIIVGIILIIAL